MVASSPELAHRGANPAIFVVIGGLRILLFTNAVRPALQLRRCLCDRGCTPVGMRLWDWCWS